jgi:hypothetical protein
VVVVEVVVVVVVVVDVPKTGTAAVRRHEQAVETLLISSEIICDVLEYVITIGHKGWSRLHGCAAHKRSLSAKTKRCSEYGGCRYAENQPDCNIR